jgi:hypothetical protein
MRSVTKALTRSAQFSDPPTETPIRLPYNNGVNARSQSVHRDLARFTHGPPASRGKMALLACAIE